MTQELINIIDHEVCTNADYLSLSFFGEIEISEIQKLLQLKNLKHLNLSSCDLIDKHLETIGKIASLELLDLDATEITDQGLFFLQHLKNLKQLRLKDNPQLTDTCVEYLSNIHSLELVHFGNTSVSTGGVRKLLSKVELHCILLENSDLRDVIDELLIITSEHPKLEITLKGLGILSNGKTERIN
jgi:hypothetical protein